MCFIGLQTDLGCFHTFLDPGPLPEILVHLAEYESGFQDWEQSSGLDCTIRGQLAVTVYLLDRKSVV